MLDWPSVAVGFVLCVAVELLTALALAALLWSGARRAGAQLVEAAEAVRPVTITNHVVTPPERQRMDYSARWRSRAVVRES